MELPDLGKTENLLRRKLCLHPAHSSI